MQKPKLFLNMIVKWDEPVDMVKRSLDSVIEFVDDSYITVTYNDKKPTDKSPLVKLLKKNKVHISYFKWIDDFSSARQYTLNQTPKSKTNFIFWQDADDVLRGGKNLKFIVDEAVRSNHAAVFFPYWYQVDLDDKGEVREIVIEHKRERIIRNDNTFKWIGPLHETLIQQAQENLVRVGRDECIVIHLSNTKRTDANLSRNINILEKAVRAHKRKDPREIIYLAKAYFDRGKFSEDKKQRKIDFDLALNLFHEYLTGSGKPGDEDYQQGSGWREERSTAYSHVGEIAIITGHPEVAVQAYKSAIDEAYEFPGYYIDIAMAYCMLKDYNQAKHWLRLATSMEMPNTTIITFPRDIKLRALQVSMDINMYENNLKLAKEDAKEILKIQPDDEGTKKNLETIDSLDTFNKACQSVMFLGKYLETKNEKDKIMNLLKSVPEEMANEKFVSEMRHLYLPSKIWADNEIAILCGPGFEKWSPKNIDKGIGGSEEAVIRMSEEMTKLGWKVTVYADPRDDAGEYNGVSYRPYYELNQKDLFNVLILWRSIGFVDFNPKAKFIGLWLHDLPNNPDLTEERINKIDKIFVMSEYQKRLLRMQKDGEFVLMPEFKVFVTANGIPNFKDDKRFKAWNGNSKRMIYMSSMDRGIIYLLKNWDKIIKEVPDAELHIFYGWELFDVIHGGNPSMQKWKKDVIEMMKKPGIIFHGRVGHDRLHFEIAQSGIWAYPTDFEEISCISAMLSQALGAVPVVTYYAALTETVKNGFKLDINIKTEEGQKEYINALIKLLKDSKQQEDIRKTMMPWAKDYFLWSSVAGNWNELFKVKLQNPEKKLEIIEVPEKGGNRGV